MKSIKDNGKITVSRVMNEIEKRARKNDLEVSEAEDLVLDALAVMKDDSDRLEIYWAILKVIYADGILEPDEGDLILFARNLLKIKQNEHQKVLAELRFI